MSNSYHSHPSPAAPHSPCVVTFESRGIGQTIVDWYEGSITNTAGWTRHHHCAEECACVSNAFPRKSSRNYAEMCLKRRHQAPTLREFYRAKGQGENQLNKLKKVNKLNKLNKLNISGPSQRQASWQEGAGGQKMTPEIT